MPPVRKFEFFRDTFAFRNELVWQYSVDEQGRVTTKKNDPPPTYAHRCFVVARSARQFLFHADFQPELPRVTEAEYRKRIRRVVGRSPREASVEDERIVFPGFAGLREFSQTHEAALKGECGPVWQSYFLRSHWRMVFPISRTHQARESKSLLEKIEKGGVPIAHIVRFPELTINHGIVLFGAREDAEGIDFDVYDPNIPEGPTALRYDARTRTFLLPRNIYWGGGRVDLYETYRGWFY